jgi:hypothetical protein
MGNLPTRLLVWLLEPGANPNISSEDDPHSASPSRTTVAVAANLHDTLPLQTFLDHGAIIEPLDLFAAIEGRDCSEGKRRGIETMTLLIDKGADVNYVSERWGTPLMFAVKCDKKGHLKRLLERGADPWMFSPRGKTTSIDYAKKTGQTGLVELMENSRATSRLETTPIH